MAPARTHPEVAGDVGRLYSAPAATPSAAALGPGALVAFVGSADLDRSRASYGGVLGLSLVAADAFALAYDVAGTALRVAAVASTVRALLAHGVVFTVYDGMDQDADGI